MGIGAALMYFFDPIRAGRAAYVCATDARAPLKNSTARPAPLRQIAVIVRPA